MRGEDGGVAYGDADGERDSGRDAEGGTSALVMPTHAASRVEM